MTARTRARGQPPGNSTQTVADDVFSVPPTQITIPPTTPSSQKNNDRARVTALDINPDDVSHLVGKLCELLDTIKNGLPKTAATRKGTKVTIDSNIVLDSAALASTLRRKLSSDASIHAALANVVNQLSTLREEVNEKFETISIPHPPSAWTPAHVPLHRRIGPPRSGNKGLADRLGPNSNTRPQPSQEFRDKTITLNRCSRSTTVLPDADEAAIRVKTNDAIEEANIRRGGIPIKVRGVRRLKSGDISVHLATAEEASTLRNDTTWIPRLDTNLRLHQPAYSIIVNNVLTEKFDPTSQADIDQLRTDNPETLDTLYKITWAKPQEVNATGTTIKKRAALIIRLKDGTQADRAIDGGVWVKGSLHNVAKGKKSLLLCTSCLTYGHSVARCTNAPRCTRCGLNGHSAKACTTSCPDDPPCSNTLTCPHPPPTCTICCIDDSASSLGHHALSPTCPSRAKQLAALEDEYALSGRFFMRPE